jgi:hypothetical protein
MYESGLGFKVFVGCPGESLYHHHHMLQGAIGLQQLQPGTMGNKFVPFYEIPRQNKKDLPGLIIRICY